MERVTGEGEGEEGGTGDAVESGQDFLDYVEPEGDEVDNLIRHKNHPRLQDNLPSTSYPISCLYKKQEVDGRGKSTSGLARMIIPTIA